MLQEILFDLFQYGGAGENVKKIEQNREAKLELKDSVNAILINGV